MHNLSSHFLLNLSRRHKRLLMLGADILMLPLALWSAFALRLGAFDFPVISFGVLYLAALLLGIPVFIRLGLYRAVVRYMGPQAMLAVFKGVTFVTIGLMILTLMLRLNGVPRSVFAIFWLLAVFYVGGSRFLIRAYLHRFAANAADTNVVAIYGAGAAGIQLASALAHDVSYQPVAFIDDNAAIQGTVINGLQVYAPEALQALIHEHKISEVLLALPSATRSQRRRIINRLEHLPVHVKTVPALPELVSGKVGVETVREVDIDDLLGREKVAPNQNLLRQSVTGKTVLVTGAAGSIGSELCRQIIQLEPAVLVLFEITEYGLYAIEKELRGLDGKAAQVSLIPVLGSVQDEMLLSRTLSCYDVDVIFHAAAYKHVPLVEHNIVSGIKNNVFGSLAVAEAAGKAGVDSVVLVSTDKAVRPTNVMGASKRLAELVLQSMEARYPNTCFSMVRFGNVLGSSGSVVPLFRKQIMAGGPVTVTHAEIYRYFMTIPEAALLVIQSCALAKGGDVFVLDMGEPVNISDLARKMIHLMGLEVKEPGSEEGDIAIEYTGLRPGEKLREELLIEGDLEGSEHPKILWSKEGYMSWEELEVSLSVLGKACERLDYEAIREVLLQPLVGYRPDHEFVDGLFMHQIRQLAEEGGEASRQIH